MQFLGRSRGGRLDTRPGDPGPDGFTNGRGPRRLARADADFRPGPGVDCVADVENLPQPDASVGTVIALSTFEHVRRFWLGFREVEDPPSPKSQTHEVTGEVPGAEVSVKLTVRGASPLVGG